MFRLSTNAPSACHCAIAPDSRCEFLSSTTIRRSPPFFSTSSREAGGQIVGTIASGLAAVGAEAVIEPDAVIMDVCLTDMNGIDAAGVIRARRMTPVVFVTGADVRAEIESRLQLLDRIEVVTKPVDQPCCAPSRGTFNRISLQTDCKSLDPASS